jgi:hypothetical protein
MRNRSQAGVWLIVGTLVVAEVTARQPGLDRAEMERVLKIARGSQAERAAFHAPYVFEVGQTVERIEVVTERRRLMLLAAARLAGGDRLFAEGTLRAEEAMRPWRGRTAVIGRVRFHPQNSYVTAPPVAIRVYDGSRELPRRDLKAVTDFALGTGAPNERLPVIGATAEALFEAAVLGAGSRDVTVWMEGKEIARLALDFSKLP